MKSVIRGSIAALGALALVLGVPLSASAGVFKSERIVCAGTGNKGITTAYSTGTTEHLPPATPEGTGGYSVYYNGSVWKSTVKTSSKTGGGWWSVETSGSMSNSGTFASCTNYN